MSKVAKRRASEPPTPETEPTAADPEIPGDRAEPEPAPEPPAAWLTWLGDKLPDDRAATIAVLVLGALLFLPFLGTLGLWDPWETHYGEVARAMVQRGDYVYPYWESAYFFSKPALTLWLMALGIVLTGSEGPDPSAPLGSLVEWGIRMPFALLAILALWAVYRLGTQLQGRRTGVLAAFVLAASPQFIFIGKQAITDNPMVFLTTAGLALFALAVFDDADDAPGSTRLRIVMATVFAVGLFSQLLLIGARVSGVGAYAGLGAAGVLGAAVVVYTAFYSSRRAAYLVGFYSLAGAAALAKGLAVLAVVGPVVVLYMLFARDFDILRRAKLWLGVPVFLLVASPWYVTLTLFKGRDDEGLTFTERFWVHDNFNRVGAGVHGDRAYMGYFIEQLAYGMFPWSALLPLSIAHGLRRFLAASGSPRGRLLLFVSIWALWSYLFFSVSLTKFHHYIFPAVPALAILVAVFVEWLAERPRERLSVAVVLTVLVLFAVSARDLMNEPRHLVNLFTYKYDRDYPRELNPRLWMGIIVGVGIAAAAGFVLLKRPAQALLSFVLMGGAFGAWVSHHHFNMLSPHWSQAHLFKTYYAERKGDEPIYAYQLNWRGETFYSRNRVLQVKEDGANERMRRLVDAPGREFIVTEQSRYQTLKSILSPDKKNKIQILDRSSNKFYLCVVED